jgi:type II secretory pathway pseudopilin PulG
MIAELNRSLGGVEAQVDQGGAVWARPNAEAPPVTPRARAIWPAYDVLLVGFVVATMIAAAVAGVARQRHAIARERFAQDLVATAAAFREYLGKNPSGPADTAPGVVPAGMEPYLANLHWTAPTPAGGLYRWTYRVPSPQSEPAARAGLIEVTSFPPGPAFTLSPADLLEIDRQIDDGNLATGNFRLGFNGWPVLSVSVPPGSP